MKRLVFALSLVLASLTAADADAARNAKASELIASASAKAGNEGKNVMVIFHASWCRWCHKLDDFMSSDQFKPMFDANYEVVHIDVEEQDGKKDLETPGWPAVSKQLSADNQGLPFFVILNKKGKILADSRNGGANIGYPSAPAEVTYFMSLLGKTAKHLTPSQASKIETYLRAKATQ
jgi:thioredoxin-related protein